MSEPGRSVAPCGEGLDSGAESGMIQRFSRYAETSQPVDETVDKLCCTWGEM